MATWTRVTGASGAWTDIASLNSIQGFQKLPHEVVAGTNEIRLNWKVGSDGTGHRPFMVDSRSVIEIVSDILW